MVMNANGMVSHDPHADAAEIRVHVCVKARRCYVFQVALIPDLDNYPVHVSKTSEGRLVPWHHFPKILTRDIPSGWTDGFVKGADDVGERAEAIVERLIHSVGLPLPGAVYRVDCKRAQIGGTDLSVNRDIQVKCDFDGGERDRGGTGNLYIETAERNPRGLR